MTNEEAIVCVKMMFAFWANTHEINVTEMEDAKDAAISALRNQSIGEPLTLDHMRETWEPCGACKDGNIKINIPEFRALAICNKHMDHEAFTLTLQTRFCPVCGRPLTPEAWQELEKRLRVEL